MQGDHTETPGGPRWQEARRTERAAAVAGVGLWSLAPGDTRAHWNEQMFRLHGLPADAAVPGLREYVQRFVAPAEREAAHAALTALTGGHQPMAEQLLNVVRADGVPRRLSVRVLAERDEAGTHLYGVMIDVTERLAASDQLRLAQARAVLAARGLGLATWEMDLATGQSTWDEPMWALRGLPPQPSPPDAAGRLALVHPEDRAALEAERAAALRERRMQHAEFRVRLPGGGWRWLASRALVVEGAPGQPARQIGVNWDITAAKQAEAARQEQVRAAAQAEARAQLLARASHDLRTPLNAVIGLAQLMLELPPGSPVPAGHAQRILQAGQALQAQVDHLLQIATPAAAAPPAPAAAPPAPGGRRLLYIEDNEVNALIVRELVARRGGVELAVAPDGASGVARALAEPPTLVLVDMQLPDMDGFEVLRRLRADPRGTAVPCVALSANAVDEDMRRARAAGFADYWTKPLDFRAFLAGLARYFGPPPG